MKMSTSLYSSSVVSLRTINYSQTRRTRTVNRRIPNKYNDDDDEIKRSRDAFCFTQFNYSNSTLSCHHGFLPPLTRLTWVLRTERLRNKTNAGDTRSTNLYQKLVQVVLYKKLARVSVNLVQVSLVQVPCMQ